MFWDEDDLLDGLNFFFALIGNAEVLHQLGKTYIQLQFGHPTAYEKKQQQRIQFTGKNPIKINLYKSDGISSDLKLSYVHAIPIFQLAFFTL